MIPTARFHPLRRALDELRRHLCPDLTLRDGGLSRRRDACVVWLECEGPGDRIWRAHGRAPSAPNAPHDRGLHLALADALADLAGRSGAGVALWRDQAG